jgi:hypothetical protein
MSEVADNPGISNTKLNYWDISYLPIYVNFPMKLSP